MITLWKRFNADYFITLMAIILVCCGLQCFIITHNHSYKIVKQFKNIYILSCFICP